MAHQVQLGGFLYDAEKHTLHLPHGLGEARIDFGFCSGTHLRCAFPPTARLEATDWGARLTTDSPLARFSCKQDIFIYAHSLPDQASSSIGSLWAAVN